MFFSVSDELDFVRISATYGSNIPPNRRVAIAEAASRINCRVAWGSFDLDFNDGELRFRIGMDVEDGVLSEKMVANMLGFATKTMELYHLPLMRVAFSEVDPEVALSDLE